MLAQLPPMVELLLSRHESDGKQGVGWGGVGGGGKAFKTPCLYSVEHLSQCHSLSASLTLFLFFLFQTALMEARKQTWRQS